MMLQSIAISLCLFMPLWAYLVTLRSLQRKQADSKGCYRFNLADGMILVAMISLGTAIGSYAKINRDTENWILIVSLDLLLVLMWCKCNRFMQENAIFDSRSRIIMQLFTFPSSIVSLSFLSLSSIMVVVGSVASFVPYYDDPVIRELPNSAFCMIAGCGWVYLTRSSFSWILQRNQVGNAG